MVATAIAVLMAVVGASILVSYARTSQLSSSNIDLVQSPPGIPIKGVPGAAGSAAGRPLMGAGKAVMRNSDGVGNVIFDYESTTAQEYAAKGEIVIAALQVRGLIFSPSFSS